MSSAKHHLPGLLTQKTEKPSYILHLEDNGTPVTASLPPSTSSLVLPDYDLSFPSCPLILLLWWFHLFCTAGSDHYRGLLESLCTGCLTHAEIGSLWAFIETQLVHVYQWWCKFIAHWLISFHKRMDSLWQTRSGMATCSSCLGVGSIVPWLHGYYCSQQLHTRNTGLSCCL